MNSHKGGETYSLKQIHQELLSLQNENNIPEIVCRGYNEPSGAENIFYYANMCIPSYTKLKEFLNSTLATKPFKFVGKYLFTQQNMPITSNTI